MTGHWSAGGRLGRMAAVAPGRVLAAIVVASCGVRILLLTKIHGPWIFPDELGYEQVAVNLARGHLALYGKTGLSYSPLYPLVLSPLYALGLSATAAYEGIKVVNAALMSLALLPVYGIARFVLPQRPAFVVVGLAALAPLMYYTALGMSENLAYPVFLLAVWCLLRTLDRPSVAHDALAVALFVVAAAVRIQFLMLLPAAFTVLVGCLAFEARASGPRLAARSLARRHATLLVGCGGLVLALGVAAVSGAGAFSFAGRYSNVPTNGRSAIGHMVKLFIYHAEGLVIVAGVVPFIGAMVGGYYLLRFGGTRRVALFAGVAFSLAIWLVAETAVSVNAFEREGDAPRVHERYLFYLVPFFLVSLVGLVRHRRARGSSAAFIVATLAAMAAVYEIPFGTVINGTIVADSFSFQVFANNRTLDSISHAALLAAAIVAALGAALLLLRTRPASVVIVVAVIFIFLSERSAVRISAAANGQHSFTTRVHRDWVDSAQPASSVAMIVGPATTDPVAEWQTDYHNLSIRRLYYTCQKTLSPDFGEQQVTVRSDGVLVVKGRPLKTNYAVVPTGFGVEGTVLARDDVAHEQLVETNGGELRLDPGAAARWMCSSTS